MLVHGFWLPTAATQLLLLVPVQSALPPEVSNSVRLPQCSDVPQILRVTQAPVNGTRPASVNEKRTRPSVYATPVCGRVGTNGEKGLPPTSLPSNLAEEETPCKLA